MFGSDYVATLVVIAVKTSVVRKLRQDTVIHNAVQSIRKHFEGMGLKVSAIESYTTEGLVDHLKVEDPDVVIIKKGLGNDRHMYIVRRGVY
jgi:hypothetical protein